MIQFRQKQFAEYDAMKSLYETIMRLTGGDRAHRFPVITSKSALISVLKGPNVVVEKFTISTSLFGKEKYRMYIKIGAKAKLPDEVRLPKLKFYEQRLGNLSLKLSGSIFPNTPIEKNNSFVENYTNGISQKEFGKGKGGGGGGKPFASGEAYNQVTLNRKVQDYLAEAIKYSKTERSLVLELSSIEDAIKALNILPFGLNYTIYLLDA